MAFREPATFLLKDGIPALSRSRRHSKRCRANVGLETTRLDEGDGAVGGAVPVRPVHGGGSRGFRSRFMKQQNSRMDNRSGRSAVIARGTASSGLWDLG